MRLGSFATEQAQRDRAQIECIKAGGYWDFARGCIPAPAPTAPVPAQITVSPAIQTQVSPQISPAFQQAFQPSGSPMTAGATQNIPTGQAGSDTAAIQAYQKAQEDAQKRYADMMATYQQAQQAQAQQQNALIQKLLTVAPSPDMAPAQAVSANIPALPLAPAGNFLTDNKTLIILSVIGLGITIALGMKRK